jgi:asparagine synthase (glutamine-hydrolysing)
MCGVAGFLGHIGRDPERVVRAMTDALRHRGPDGRGTWVDAGAGVALGHRRLAVLDPSPAGRQPMSSASGRYVVSLNGEIYNFRRLRAELEPVGHRFRGGSDTEVLLAAADRWGVDATLGRLEGMFAFALWDRAERTLTLARDRLGKKPLYYGRFGGSLLFGSELRVLREHPDFVGEIERDALGQLLHDGWLSGEHTIYRHVRRLPPASYLRLRPGEGDGAGPRPFWSAREAAEAGARRPFAGPYEAALDRLDALLRAAVEDRLAADVPLGALLSGGIDSSVVVALMRAVGRRPVRTFSIGFDDPELDEAGHARAVAGHLGTRHHELYVGSREVLEVVGELPAIQDEPLGDNSAVPSLLLARLARREVTVALSGDGGDELFLGYTSYLECLERWRSMRRVPLVLRELAHRTGVAAGRLAWALPGAGGTARPRGWRRLARKLERRTRQLPAASPEELLGWSTARSRGVGGLVLGAAPTATPLSDPGSWARLDDPLRAMAFYNVVGYLPDDILAKVDRVGMAVGLEVRCPLLDTRVAEFAWSLPTGFLVDGRGGKRILKDLLARHVPREITERPKRGFGMPVDRWLRGPLRGWAEELLAEPLLRRQGLLDAGRVRRVWEQHQAGWCDYGDLLWTLLMFQAWWAEHGGVRAEIGPVPEAGLAARVAGSVTGPATSPGLSRAATGLTPR